ncbi:MAG TPA: radical SAM protein, partial [Thermoplasmata archaeon]|nr:radical SAM protein [Thermoplasmata archaeon]
MSVHKGRKIVITSDSTTMSPFGDDAFQAFLCTFPIGFIGKYVAPLMKAEFNEDGTPRYASYGQRKVEAVLAKEFGEENVVVAHADNVEKFVGEDTRVLGVSCHDPMGLAYVSTTYNSLIGFGGDAVTYHYFKELMAKPVFRPKSERKYSVLAGGPGVWQIKDTNMQDTWNIDTLVYGDAERDLPPLMQRVLDGEDVGREAHLSKVNPFDDDIPTILKPSTFGCVEITRGCGRGCQFCFPTLRRRYSFPVDYVMKEVETNVKGGNKSVFIVSDDIFLYYVGPNFIPNRPKVIELFTDICEYPGVEEVHLSHAAMAPICYDPKMIEELSHLLLQKTKRRLNGKPYQTVEIGVETGSPRILKKSMRGKALPYSVDEWPERIDQGLGILNDNSIFPLCTFQTGMPGETEEDTLATMELFDRIKDKKLFYVPLLFIPIEGTRWGKEKRTSLKNFTELQWDIVATGWKRNLDIWGGENKALIRFGSFWVYWMYLRWKHGKNSARPALKFMGFPEGLFKQKIGKPCDKAFCEDEGEKEYEGFDVPMAFEVKADALLG